MEEKAFETDFGDTDNDDDVDQQEKNSTPISYENKIAAHRSNRFQQTFSQCDLPIDNAHPMFFNDETLLPFPRKSRLSKTTISKEKRDLGFFSSVANLRKMLWTAGYNCRLANTQSDRRGGRWPQRSFVQFQRFSGFWHGDRRESGKSETARRRSDVTNDERPLQRFNQMPSFETSGKRNVLRSTSDVKRRVLRIFPWTKSERRASTVSSKRWTIFQRYCISRWPIVEYEILTDGRSAICVGIRKFKSWTWVEMNSKKWRVFSWAMRWVRMNDFFSLSDLFSLLAENDSLNYLNLSWNLIRSFASIALFRAFEVR